MIRVLTITDNRYIWIYWKHVTIRMSTRDNCCTEYSYACTCKCVRACLFLFIPSLCVWVSVCVPAYVCTHAHTCLCRCRFLISITAHDIQTPLNAPIIIPLKSPIITRYIPLLTSTTSVVLRFNGGTRTSVISRDSRI